MILVDLPTRITCAEPGCLAYMPAHLCLLTTGGFAFKPEDGEAFEKDWQVGAGSNGVFMCFCAAHKKEEKRLVQVGPAGPRLNSELTRKTH